LYWLWLDRVIFFLTNLYGALFWICAENGVDMKT